MNDDQRKLAIETALEKIEKLYGSGSISILGRRKSLELETIDTSLLGLHEALGCKGMPVGRIIELYGPESSGKTTLAMHAIADVQKKFSHEGAAAIVDVEHSIDFKYIEKLGVDVKKLIFSQPNSAEEALDIVDGIIRSGGVKIVVLDSIAALVPKSELEGSMGDSHMGLQARLMGQALRKITAAVSKTGCIVIFINQLRHKIGVMFGSPETTTGGNAMKFYASIRLDVRRVATVRDSKDNIIGHTMRMKVVKNKVAPPSKVVDFEMRYGEGICRILELIDYGIKFGILEKSGSWYSFKGNKLAQGKENVKQHLKQESNKPLFDEVYSLIKEKLSKL
ncbi:MAG: recombinase RecA [Pseudomonadota bacterium]